MDRNHRNAIAALAGAGALWGLTVPLSKLSLAWLAPAWLTAARFALAAAVLGLVARRELRAAFTPLVVGTGAIGFGVVVVLQNMGIERTSVSAAAIVIGAVPVLVAVLAAAAGATIGPRAWAGSALALAGVILVAGAGGTSTMTGDGLVFASSVLSAAFVVLQPRVLAGRDVAAVTAVQFGAATLVALLIASVTGVSPGAPPALEPVIAFVGLSLAGTVLPFWLFATGQTRVRPDVAGAYLNLEPIVGTAVGWLAFGNPTGSIQLAGMLVVLVGIGLATVPGRTLAPRGTSAPHEGYCA